MNEIKSRCRFFYNLILLLILGLVSSPIVFAQSGQITGKILPSDSNAIVYVISPTQEVVDNAPIGINGEYSFNLPIGIYDLFIRSGEGYNNKTIFQIGVNENEITEVPNITLSRIGETGSISGYVNPQIEGLKVEVRKFGSGEGDFSITSPNGYYKVTDLEPDTYGIFVRFNSTYNFYDYKWGMIDVYANSSLTGINLTLTPRIYKYLIDRIVVEFQPSISENEKKAIISSFNSRIMSHYSYNRHYVVSVHPDKTPEQMVVLFENDTRIKDANIEKILSVRSGTDYTEENQGDTTISSKEIEEKTKQLKAIVEEIESKNIGENVKTSIENKVNNGDLDASKGSKFLIIMLSLILLIILVTAYLITKWKKRV